jgi:hypothetical protein
MANQIFRLSTYDKNDRVLLQMRNRYLLVTSYLLSIVASYIYYLQL